MQNADAVKTSFPYRSPRISNKNFEDFVVLVLVMELVHVTTMLGFWWFPLPLSKFLYGNAETPGLFSWLSPLSEL